MLKFAGLQVFRMWRYKEILLGGEISDNPDLMQTLERHPCVIFCALTLSNT
jgi:hypothetical protein